MTQNRGKVRIADILWPLQQMYNLSLKFKSETSKLDYSEKQAVDKCDIVVKKEASNNQDENNIGLGHLTISINKVPNYSLKNSNRKKSCWNSFLPEQYLSLFRGIFSAFMLVTTVFAIYGIVKLLDIKE